MRSLARLRRLVTTGVAFALVGIGLLLVIRFLIPKTLDDADKWASVFSVVLAYLALMVPCAVWVVRTVSTPRIAQGMVIESKSVLDSLLRASLARTGDSWSALGVSTMARQRLEALADNPENIPNLTLPPSGMVVVTGQLGTGKSFYAEYIHRQHIRDALASAQSPWPCLLRARDLEEVDLSTAILAAAPADWRHGYRVVLDGCDEVSRDIATRLLREAGIFGSFHENSLVVLLSRPGYLSIDAELALPETTDTFAVRLMSAVAGHPVTMNDVDSEMVEIVRRPLFAILYARLGFRALRSRTTAGLLSALVEDVLLRDRATSDQLFAMLRSLAARTMTHGGMLPLSEAGGLDQREKLLETRLVVVRGASVYFAAPVIEQYFAAQALLQGEIDLGGQLASLRIWETWRPAWVLAVAIGNWEEATRLISTLASKFPGAAAWLVHQALPYPNHSECECSGQLDTGSVERRLQQAFDSWCTAFPEILKFGSNQGATPKIVARSYDSGTLFLGVWDYMSQPTQQQVAEGMQLFQEAEGWWTRGMVRLGCLPAWPWRTTLNLVVRGISAAVQSLARNGSVPSLQNEQRWATIKHLAPSNLRHRLSEDRNRPEAREAILTEIERHMTRIREHRAVRYRFNNLELRLDDLEDLHDCIMKSPATVLNDPWPGPNHPPSGGDWFGYDLERLVERTAAVYAAAFDAYAHLVHARFPGIANTLELTILMPLRMQGYVDVDHGTPGIYFELWPQAVSPTNQFNLVASKAPPELWEETQRRHRRMTHDLELYRPDSATWVHTGSTVAALSIFGERPAAELAFRWLWDDLKYLHLVESSAPNFGF